MKPSQTKKNNPDMRDLLPSERADGKNSILFYIFTIYPKSDDGFISSFY